MADPARQLRINAVELLRQPGTTREISLAVPADVSGVEHPAITGDISVDVTLEALNGGIAVHGSLRVPWSGVCRRGLIPLDGVDSVDVDELYQLTPVDPDAFLIEGGQLDLCPMVRELSLLALDDERLCAQPCSGPCPSLEVDADEFTAAPEVRDERWSALDGLVLDTD